MLESIHGIQLFTYIEGTDDRLEGYQHNVTFRPIHRQVHDLDDGLPKDEPSPAVATAAVVRRPRLTSGC